ncbi:MAG: hypothetical protein ACERLM_11960, partial [Acidimicrobiales bacterium]
LDRRGPGLVDDLIRSLALPARRRTARDLLVEIVVETPTELSDEEQDLLRQMAEIRGLEVAPPDEGFFSKIKSAFR